MEIMKVTHTIYKRHNIFYSIVIYLNHYLHLFTDNILTCHITIEYS